VPPAAGGGRASLRLVRLTLAAIAAAAAVSGCGDEDALTTTTTASDEAPTKREFIFEADRICFSADSQIEAAADDLATAEREPPPAEVRRVVLRVVVPALETEVRAIRSLGAPRGDEAQVAAILDATERGIAQIEADPEGVLEGPPPALREAGRLAKAYGSRQCGIN